MATMDDLFAPPAYQWRRLSPRYLSLQRMSALITWPVLFSIPALLVGLLAGLWWLAVLLGLAGIAIALARYSFLPRSFRSWGYVEREDDLYISHGVWFRTLTAVPYGRMQLVEVESGPLDRRFNLAKVTLKTASPNTSATIPGLDPDEAARLRDQLTKLGEAQASGL
jgi:uncharacterized protein